MAEPRAAARIHRAVWSGIAVLAAVAAAACGSAPVDARTELRQAKDVIDAANAVHFKLTSGHVGGTGAVITGGEGDMRRPSAFAGTLDVTVSGFAVGVQIVSFNGTFYVKLPTDTGFHSADAADYGFGDPAKLLDKSTGLSSLLLQCSNPQRKESDRYQNEQLDEIGCSLPGKRVGDLLTTEDATQPVAATFGINPDNHQLRRAVLTGPFFSKTSKSTFTVVLVDYGENVSVTPPATS
ncbi:MAG TPA: LppX_LprAFG lipoprotein [Candidatus Dormibacteraeota bacterium]|nr:LppX_LprAFG lipoprotein [Candidatus Dormibacteraeota bacterium]